MAANIDVNTGLVYQVKRPVEDRTYTVDFAKIVPSGVTIASIQSVTAVASGLATEVAAIVVAAITASGTKVTFSASGGTDDEDYEVTISCTDSSGDELSDDVLLKVRKAGLK